MIIKKPLIDYYNEKLKEKHLDSEFTILTKNIISSQQEITFFHKKCNSEFLCTPNNFMKRKRCTKCNPPSKKYTTENFKKKFFEIYSANDFEMIGNYGKNNKDNVSFKCKHCGYIKTMRAVDWLCHNSHGISKIYSCEKCKPKHSSKEEIELYKYISSIYKNNIITNDRTILNGKELDIYLPDINIAIEYNGLYWHSDAIESDPYYHLNKSIECEKQNIRLIHIFEDQWIYDKENIKKIIFDIIKNPNILIYKSENILDRTLNPIFLLKDKKYIIEDIEYMFINKNKALKRFKHVQDPNDYNKIYDCGKFILL